MLVCRFCMSKTNVEIDLFQAALVPKFVCLPVKILKDDILPKKICYQCEQKLYDFYGFWKCIQNVEQMLMRKISGKNNANNYSEEDDDDGGGGGGGGDDDEGDEGDDEDDDDVPDISRTSQAFLEPEVVMSTPNAMYVNSNSAATKLTPSVHVTTVASAAATAPKTAPLPLPPPPPPQPQHSKTPPHSSCSTEDNEEEEEEEELETNALEQYWQHSKDYANNNNYDSVDKAAIKIEEFEDDENLLVHFMVDSQEMRAGARAELKKCQMQSKNEYNNSAEAEEATASATNNSGATKKSGKKPKSHECNLCGKILRSPGLLKSHIDEDHNFLRVQCKFCDKRIKKKNFRKHLRTHDRSPKMPHSCPTCGKLFYFLKSLYAHMNGCTEAAVGWAARPAIKLETGADDDSSHCAAGDGGGKELELEHEHIKVDEPNRAENGAPLGFYCDTCQKEIGSEEQFERHKSLHDKCTCSVCGKVLASKTILKRHMDVHTNDVVCVQCPVCGKAFTRDSNLKAHMKIHLNLRTHVCDECGKPFRRKYHLTRHMLTHSGEKPFPCAWCEKKYTSKESLRCHQKTSHFNVVL